MRKQTIYSSRIWSRSNRRNNSPVDMGKTPCRNSLAYRARGRSLRPAIYAGVIALILACILLPCATKKCVTPVTDGRTVDQPLSEGIKQGIKDFTPADDMDSALYSVQHFVQPKQMKKQLDINKKSEPKVYDFGTKLEIITDPNAK